MELAYELSNELGWLGWLSRFSGWLLISAQVMISRSWDGAHLRLHIQWGIWGFSTSLSLRPSPLSCMLSRSSKFYNFVHIPRNHDGQFKLEKRIYNGIPFEVFLQEKKYLWHTQNFSLGGVEIMDNFPQWLEFNSGKWCKTLASKLSHPWDMGTGRFTLELPSRYLWFTPGGGRYSFSCNGNSGLSCTCWSWLLWCWRKPSATWKLILADGSQLSVLK